MASYDGFMCQITKHRMAFVQEYLLKLKKCVWFSISFPVNIVLTINSNWYYVTPIVPSKIRYHRLNYYYSKHSEYGIQWPIQKST